MGLTQRSEEVVSSSILSFDSLKIQRNPRGAETTIKRLVVLAQFCVLHK